MVYIFNVIVKFKLISDSSGFSKGYGFVRFGTEEEQKSALYEMNGFIGLGSKPLKICNAVPKPKLSSTATNDTSTSLQNLATTNAMTEFSQYYDPSTYWQNSALYGQAAPQTWTGYDPTMVADYAAYYQQQVTAHMQQESPTAQQNDASQISQAYQQQSDLTLVGNYQIDFSIESS